jgi:hypothetical protein
MTIAELEERLARVENEVAELRQREVERSQSNPWLRMQGTLPDDELTAQWRQAMAAYRDECDRELTQG